MATHPARRRLGRAAPVVPFTAVSPIDPVGPVVPVGRVGPGASRGRGRAATPASAAHQLLLQVLADVDADDGVLIWLLDDHGCLAGLLAGPPTWPVAVDVTDLLIEHALDDDAAAVVVVRRRAGPALVTADDEAGFAAFDAACGRVDLTELWHLVDTGTEIVVQELR
jgi:hypothetical protein